MLIHRAVAATSCSLWSPQLHPHTQRGGKALRSSTAHYPTKPSQAWCPLCLGCIPFSPLGRSPRSMTATPHEAGLRLSITSCSLQQPVEKSAHTSAFLLQGLTLPKTFYLTVSNLVADVGHFSSLWSRPRASLLKGSLLLSTLWNFPGPPHHHI